MSQSKKVQTFFGQNAEAYVKSNLHAKGKDLIYLVREQTEVGRLLDIATGGGHVAHAFAGLSDDITAFDLTPEILIAARNYIEGNGHKHVQYVEGDVMNMPFTDSTYDTAICRIAAHHFPDIQQFVNETHRVLKQNGVFWLLDNVALEDDKLDEFYNVLEKQRDTSHVRAYKKSEWLQIIEKSGFDIEQCKVFRKTFQIDDWSRRAGINEETKHRLKQMLIKSSDHVKDFLHIEEENGSIQSFQGQSIALKACKR
ncbi:class I SAM-dependent methyltransferase [Alkalicoccobacillus porphyridii]|uniref:Methyltransferase domain-containing protein n=1 Tax=Alkalicoccobacillus porphyridii TaxID=2597270 RepID=A0A553ZVD0_9BACI|nr:class I SAM-dependent methyltransferase [Alkalicoccobacillus porphyridii]TSB45434.1 methyltransferase domain-containing protein [Alkalicoccobacillus porphyridii]